MPRRTIVVLALAVTAAAVPTPALSLSAPRTLAARVTLGALEGEGPVVEPGFAIDFLGLSWGSGDEPLVRFRSDGAWAPWRVAHLDDLPRSGGRTWSRLVPAGGAEAFQVRGSVPDLRAHAINTTDGPRSLRWETSEASAHHVAQPPVVSRAGWGADESLRFGPGGAEKGTRTFFPTERLIVHHTATANDDPDPAATIRGIYHYHVQSRGFSDIAYNFLIDEQGVIYKGRYSGPQGTTDQDTLTGEDAAGNGVTGAHTKDWNSGSMGVAILGDLSTRPIAPEARGALVEHLAWEAERHGLDPRATVTHVNPASGAERVAGTISGHRDWVSTACPGEHLYGALPAIRDEVAARTGAIAPLDTEPPRISKIVAKKLRRRSAVIRWRTGEPATARVRYRQKGEPWAVTPVDWTLGKRHALRLRGLERGTGYRFVVLSRDAAGNAGRGRLRSFITKG